MDFKSINDNLLFLNFIVIISVFCFFTGCNQKPNKTDQKPNILFFFVDDMGWQETSVPFYKDSTALNKRYHTPNMEKLAAQGVKFTEAYATAVCSPTRISLMTGMNAARHQVTNWTLRKGQSPDPEHPGIRPPEWNVNGLAPGEGIKNTVQANTLPMFLKNAGYTTIHVGKAHFGAMETPGADPTNLGFDVNIAGHAAGGPGSYHGDKNFSAVWRDGDSIWDVPDLEKYHGREINLTEALTREAITVLDSVVAQDQPFYLYMSHYAVHAPWEKDRRFYQKYRDRGLSEFEATYASMVESMDHSLGNFMDQLQKLGIADNTIIVFMSDNGSPKQAPQNKPLRGHKLTPYEGGIRVPMIVKWPGVSKPGTEQGQYVIIEDIFPTFLELAGIDKKKYSGQSVDGESFVPLLTRQEPVNAYKNRSIFWHFPHTYDQFPYSVVRKGPWKLIYYHTGRKLELYNVDKDIGESKELSDAHPGKVKELAKVLTNHLKTTNAGMPVDKETGQRVEYPAEVLKRNLK